jgi:ABC-2 type transport system permease protein
VIPIFRKELADHLMSRRFLILFTLVLLTAIFATYVATQTLRKTVSENTEFVFLTVFTTSGERLPSFVFFLSLFIPIISIALGFDAINSERTSGNLSRLLSQPIYRDAVINGKFLAGLAVIAIIVISVIAIVSGLGLRIVGVPPDWEEVFRLLVFALVTVIYGAFWLALSTLFSILFKSSVTSMLASFGLWVFFFFFMSMIAGAVANALVPVDQSATVATLARNVELQGAIARISPRTLYEEAAISLLVPEIGSLNLILMMAAIAGGRMVTPLPLVQSLLLIWPQIVAMIALAAICFAVSYIKFMKEEIRAF